MKVISKNAELFILLLIIFYVFFTLTVMYENKINDLKQNMGKESDCISEDSLYFQINDGNKYKVYMTFKKKIAEGYVKVEYENINAILELDTALVDSLIENTTYIITIENTSDFDIMKNNLQELINVNRLIAVEREV